LEPPAAFKIGCPADFVEPRYAGGNSLAAGNPQKSPRKAGLFVGWWRRRESNPRPKVIRARRYMLSAPLDLAPEQHDVRSALRNQPDDS
jgi:hypothetical protein